MATEKTETPKAKEELKSYADGWIMEREGQPIPMFLKIATPIISLAGAAYLYINMNGEVTNAERGPFVQQMNRATTSADGLMTVICVMIAIYAVIVTMYVLAKAKHKD